MAHDLIDKLRAACGDENVVTHPHQLRTYESDGLLRYRATPRAVVLPGSDAANADAVARRLATSIEQSCTAPDGEALRLETGTAQLDDGMDADQLMARADLALMDRKAASEA